MERVDTLSSPLLLTLYNLGKLGDILYFLPLFHHQSGGTNLEERGRGGIGDPGQVFTTML